MLPFSPDEYKAWIKSRGPVGAWDHESCRRADAHIKAVAISNFMNLVKGLHPTVEAWMDLMISHTFGSAETDEMLKELGCYPDYIE